MFLNKPPELPHILRPLVTAFETTRPSTFGAEPAPTERPIPYLQYWGIVQSWPASSITRFLITWSC